MVETPSHVHFSLPITAGRPVGGEGLVFSREEVLAGDVTRVGPAMVLFSGMGNLSLGFDFPCEAPLLGASVFRFFARKLIRSIPSPFFALSLENDALNVLFLALLDNLEIRWMMGEDRFSVAADAREYSVRFGEEESRLREVLSAAGEMELFKERCALVRMNAVGE